MDGRTALAYSRIRFSSDDLDRIQRQQRVIFAAIDKGKSLDVLSRAPDLWAKYNDAIETDINNVVGYADAANEVKDNISAVSLGDATVPFTGPQGQAWQVFDWRTVEKIVAALFEDRPGALVEASQTPEPVRVQIQNGTGTDGLAGDVASFIAGNGYRLEDLLTGNAYDGISHDVSVVLDLNDGHERSRLLLASMLGIDPDNARPATAAERSAIGNVGAEIVIILGSDVDYGDLIQSPTTTTPGG
jgi:hypothetical protein